MNVSKPHSELLRYWLSDAHSHADPKFLDRNQVIEDALALARELESTLEQYEGALATIETLESKEELSAIIRSQTEEIESLSEQLEAAESEVQQWRDSIATEKLRWRAEEAEEKLAALADCVMKGWTEPAFARGHLQERAVAIAREALNPATRRCEKCQHEAHEPGACGENVGTGYQGAVLCRCGVSDPATETPSLREQLEAAQKALREIEDMPVEESYRNGWTRDMQRLAREALNPAKRPS